MGPGHFVAGLAAKPLVPKVPLLILLAASELPDLLYSAFQAAGIENPGVTTVDFNQGIKVLVPGSTPWSHSLFMCIVWSVLAAALAYLFYRDRRTSSIIGLVVFSHWVLDFIVNPGLPLLFEGSPKVGLGLWTSNFPLSVILDLGLFVVGLVIYIRWLMKRRSLRVATGTRLAE